MFIAFDLQLLMASNVGTPLSNVNVVRAPGSICLPMEQAASHSTSIATKPFRRNMTRNPCRAGWQIPARNRAKGYSPSWCLPGTKPSASEGSRTP